MQTSFLITSLLVLALAFQSQATSRSHSPNNPVLDSDGNEVQAGQDYFLVSAAQRGGGGGGVALDRRHSSQSSIVKQQSSSSNYGSPVSFSPASNDDILIRKDSPFKSAVERSFFGNSPSSTSQERTINEETDVNIRFSEMPVVWQVQESRQSSSSSSHSRYITIGGQPGNPGSSTVRNWFQIELISRSNSNPDQYRITYCPDVCDSCHVKCGNVSIKEENGKRWLAVTQHGEFPFVFVRANRG